MGHNLNFDQATYDWMMENFDPEENPNSIDELMNMLNAGDRAGDVIEAMMQFMDSDDYYYDDDEMLSFDDLNEFFEYMSSELNMQLTFDQDTYDWMMESFLPEGATGSTDELMNRIGGAGESDYIMSAFAEFMDDDSSDDSDYYYDMEDMVSFDDLNTFFMDLGNELNMQFTFDQDTYDFMFGDSFNPESSDSIDQLMSMIGGAGESEMIMEKLMDFIMSAYMPAFPSLDEIAPAFAEYNVQMTEDAYNYLVMAWDENNQYYYEDVIGMIGY